MHGIMLCGELNQRSRQCRCMCVVLNFNIFSLLPCSVFFSSSSSSFGDTVRVKATAQLAPSITLQDTRSLRKEYSLGRSVTLS